VQNLAEGSQASGTSKKMELKLTTVARSLGYSGATMKTSCSEQKRRKRKIFVINYDQKNTPLGDPLCLSIGSCKVRTD
jgi:hypothetical protein